MQFFCVAFERNNFMMVFTNEIGMDPVVLSIIFTLLGCAIGALVVFFVPFFKKLRAQGQAKKIIREAEIKAEHITKNAQLDGKQAIIEMKQEANREIQERKQEVTLQENKLLQREQNIDRRDQALTSKEQSLDDKNETLNRRLKDLDKKESQLQVKIDSIIAELEKVAQMSSQEAHDELFARVESKMTAEIALYMKNKEEEAKEECEQKAKEMLEMVKKRARQGNLKAFELYRDTMGMKPIDKIKVSQADESAFDEMREAMEKRKNAIHETGSNSDPS